MSLHFSIKYLERKIKGTSVDMPIEYFRQFCSQSVVITVLLVRQPNSLFSHNLVSVSIVVFFLWILLLKTIPIENIFTGPLSALSNFHSCQIY